MKEDNVCKGLNFNDCELAILRMAVDKSQERIGKKIVNSPQIQEMIQIVEDFLKRKNLVCYGGQSINEELPEQDRFYNKDVDIPDYDFYSPNALNDAKELANIFYGKGYEEVEAKAGQHHGTYKVYVDFIPIADITFLPKELFLSIKREAIRINGILYAPPNLLKMGMYLELSRPVGDISRWEKVLKRLTLLNKYYPIASKECYKVDFQREMSDTTNEDTVYETVRNSLVNQGVVFFGGYAISLYSKYMPRKLQKKLKRIADFDVLSNDPETTAQIVKERLKDINIKNVKIIKREGEGEIIPEHYEVVVGKDSVAFIYKPVACHSYNMINIDGQKVKIATIDTMLSFYLAFLYSNRPYFIEFSDRILCMSKFLFEVQQKNRLEQNGLLKRFSIECYGHQETIEEMRAHKAKMYKELQDKKGTREYDEWFLNYRPDEHNKDKIEDKNEDKDIKKDEYTVKPFVERKISKKSNKYRHMKKSTNKKIRRKMKTRKNTQNKGLQIY